MFIANTHDYLPASNRGRVPGSRSGKCRKGTRNRGKPIVNMFPLADGEKIITVVLPVKEFSGKIGAGTVKQRCPRCPDLSNPRKAGIIAVDLDDGDYLIGADLPTASTMSCCFLIGQGRAL